MKWFLQFLSFGSVLMYTLLVIVDHRISDGSAEHIVVSRAQPNQRLSAWGPHLPERSFRQDRQVALSANPARQQNAFAPKDQQARQHLDQEPGLEDGAVLPIAGGTSEPSVAPQGKEAIWFVVSRAARLHAGPSISSPITHFYPVGTELKLIGYEQGWFHVLHPATMRQGWIYEKYYLQAISGPGQTQVAMSESLSPTPTRVAYRTTTPKPKPISRVKKPRYKQKVTKPKSGQHVRIARAREYKPFRGYY